MGLIPNAPPATSSTRLAKTSGSSRPRWRTLLPRPWRGTEWRTRRTRATRTARRSSRLPENRHDAPIRALRWRQPCGMGWWLSLCVASVQQVGRDQGYDHDARRPAQAWAERVVVGEGDADGEAADLGEHQDDQDAARLSVPAQHKSSHHLTPSTLPP